MDAGMFWVMLLAAVVLIGLAVLGMSVGVIARGRCLRGSCGGPEVRLASGEKVSCSTCPNRKTGQPL
jgi:hypothetical protein